MPPYPGTSLQSLANSVPQEGLERRAMIVTLRKLLVCAENNFGLLELQSSDTTHWGNKTVCSGPPLRAVSFITIFDRDHGDF